MHGRYALLMPEIRPLTNEDAENWLRLRLEALRGEPLSFSKSPDEQKPIAMESPNGFTLGAFESGDLVGTVSFMREPNAKERHKGHVLGLYVRPSARGKRTGEALISALIAKAKDHGVEQLVLGVMETSEAALRLYRRCGFSVYGKEPQAVRAGEDYIGVIHMYLRLAKL